jgi:hypothetical protein
MKKPVLSILGLSVIALAGCNIASQEDQLENSIAASLSNQGEVKQVELTKQDDDNFTGFALIRDRNGREGRLNCTARRTTGSNFDWRCSPTIDESVVTEMEGIIQTELARQATVLEVNMTRQDDNRMTGFARLQDGSGTEIRTNCTATRDAAGTANFNWRCQPGEGGEQVEAPTPAAAPAEGEGDKE